jgi:hypothetical protein
VEWLNGAWGHELRLASRGGHESLGRGKERPVSWNLDLKC